MMVKTTRQLVLFSSIYLCLKLLDVKATGVFFEEDEIFGGRESGPSMAPIFNKVFHLCGIDEACNFVVQNNLTKMFTKVSKVEDLPLDKDNFKVWHKKKVKPLELKNIALYKTSSQCSTFPSKGVVYSQNYANDGNYKTCAKTNYSYYPWWRVDLGDVAIIERIAVGSGNWLRGTFYYPFDIRVGNDNRNGGINNPFCAASVSLLHEMNMFTCPTMMMGRYVSIHLNREKYLLLLCEVEVYGWYE